MHFDLFRYDFRLLKYPHVNERMILIIYLEPIKISETLYHYNF